ncbi:MAG: hypothetical protein AAF383_29065 [Cyanobacteria bacterium P01_A01_bin.83]
MIRRVIAIVVECGGELPTFYGGSRLLMLDDATATTVPSAVIYYVGNLNTDTNAILRQRDSAFASRMYLKIRVLVNGVSLQSN